MISYTFTADRYITKGINEDVPAVIVMYLWNLIEERKKDNSVSMDHLQVFELHGEVQDNVNHLVITHRQEQPPYEKVYKLDHLAKVRGKIFVIDDIDHVTMMLAEEY